MPEPLADLLDNAAFAFRGYNVTNQGRSAELLAHPVYGATVRATLQEAADICTASIGRPIDLVRRVRDKEPTTLASFAEDIGVILAMEMAQVRLLREVFGIELTAARVSFGYSLGEIAALVAGGAFGLHQALPALMATADDCAALAADVTMGVLFSRGAALELDQVQRLCRSISGTGRGVLAVSSILSPNSLLLLGQGDSVERFRLAMPHALTGPLYLRINRHRWPPLHTPIMWARSIPNRTGWMLQSLPGPEAAPRPPVLSLVTGDVSYNDYNAVEVIVRWVDHPQRLWDAVCALLVAGVETVIHVGPEANLIPATFKRLADNVQQQLAGRSLNSLRLRAVSGLARRPWLAQLLPSQAALLRAPYVRHVLLEDWLLEQRV
jgi:[acyl-carrier-protein] S-malonyltransferase